MNSLIGVLRELAELGVSFVSLTEALDSGHADWSRDAGLLSLFAEFEQFNA